MSFCHETINAHRTEIYFVGTLVFIFCSWRQKSLCKASCCPLVKAGTQLRGQDGAGEARLGRSSTLPYKLLNLDRSKTFLLFVRS